jgi:hypothetical protein
MIGMKNTAFSIAALISRSHNLPGAMASGDETLCRQHRPAEGHQASFRLHEIGIHLPRIPGPTRAQESRR